MLHSSSYSLSLSLSLSNSSNLSPPNHKMEFWKFIKSLVWCIPVHTLFLSLSKIYQIWVLLTNSHRTWSWAGRFQIEFCLFVCLFVSSSSSLFFKKKKMFGNQRNGKVVNWIDLVHFQPILHFAVWKYYF